MYVWEEIGKLTVSQKYRIQENFFINAKTVRRIREKTLIFEERRRKSTAVDDEETLTTTGKFFQCLFIFKKLNFIRI